MRIAVFILVLFMLALVLSRCNSLSDKDTAPVSEWLNHSDTATYVGMNTCRQCHSDKHATFIHTGMGRSFDLATREKSAAVFGPHVNVYDSVLDLFYHPYWEGDSLRIKEFRLFQGDTVHMRVETIDYIIGSGQHTNSHMLAVNGYLFQAPITFYTQKEQWDMAPGMTGGFNSRFSRVIETECITCHNGLPDLVAGSVNKYSAVPLGIDCERCHGPGSVHVSRIAAGISVDTANDIDYSIVNPRHLSTELQNDLCFRCHLQCVNVLHPGADYADFKPGMRIKDFWNIFLPRFDGKNDQFLMASQADRMVQSKCFISSGKMSCITCHNPHISVKETTVAQFNKPCKDCHTGPNNDCTEVLSARKLSNDDCSGCHIPKSGSIDIPHVSISDHKIQVPGREAEKPEGRFTGLVALTDDQISPVNKARGYLRYFESYVSERSMLDSAAYWLQQGQKDPLYGPTEIHLLFLKNQYGAVTERAAKMVVDKVDAWTAYRIGESWMMQQNAEKALPWLSRAVEILPLNMDFNLKLGSAFYVAGETDKALERFRFICSEDPLYEKAWMNTAACLLLQGDLNGAESALLKAIALDPDYLQARVTLTDLYLKKRQRSDAGKMLQYLDAYHAQEPIVAELRRRYRSL